MRKLFICCLILLFFALSGLVEAAIIVVEEPGVDPELVKNARQVTAVFDAVMAQELNVILATDVRIFLTADRSSYAAVLQREIGQSKELSERNAKVTGGMSNATRQVIVLNGGAANVKSLGGFAMLVAHELFHQIQGQLEGSRKVRLYWLSEGSADYVGALVSERLGVLNIDGWKKQRINILRKTPAHVSPQEIADLTLAQWTALIEQKRAPYEMSDLMVMFLLEQGGGNAALAEYFRQCNRLQDGKKALKATFGSYPGDFSLRFTSWFNALLAQKGSLEIEASGPVPIRWIAEAKNAIAKVSAIMDAKWDLPLQSSLRIVLVSSPAEFGRLLSRELGYAPEVVEKMKQETWRFSSRGIAIIQASLPQSDLARGLAFTDVAARMWFADTVPAALTNRLRWLGSGGSLYAAAMAGEALFPGSAARQQELWLKRLDGEIPTLNNLTEAPVYQATTQRLGIRKVYAVCGLATLLLLEKYGSESYGKWLRATREKGDPQLAFAAVYGLSPEAFAFDFQAWLAQHMRKAA